VAKVWKDANEIIKQAEVPKRLLEFEKEMKKMPNSIKIKEGKERKKQNNIKLR